MTPDFIIELRKHVGNAELWLLGVTMVVVRGADGDEEVLLVRRADDGRWTPVTGIVDPGEVPDDAGVREVLEETALHVEVDKLLSIQVTRKVEYPNGDRAQYLDHAFLASVAVDTGGAGNGAGGAGDGTSVSEPHPADGENTAAEWVPLAEIPAMGTRFDRTVELAIATRRGESDGAVLFGAEERRR
ncbi:NUDIX domain-containing protein [Corynebacterium xerosis]|uniref:NUDIX domain-containing protein n=1 Tax=Corynebacterium xerosis TaxID=1725 RepID=UPI000EB35445|nr:NUDIX domain-containing protein [Corynebacterium xerosis]AYJ34182.1 NUDIX domain-containing protein [Corynebacterium xerosis]